MIRLQILVYLISSLSLFESKQLDFLNSNKTEVDINDYNFYAIIAPVGRYEAYCGSTLISPLFLISAYHCIKYTSPKEKWLAHFGVANICEPPTGFKVDVQTVYFHGQAVSDTVNVKHDVALLKLATEMTTIQPAKLSLKAPVPGEVGVIIGYEGWNKRLQSKEKLPSGVPRKASGHQKCPLLKKLQMVQMKSECPNEESDGDYEGQFCSYNPPESFAGCRMDSGGPWFHETRHGYKILVGVSTFGDLFCNRRGINGLYTDVYAYRNWIDNVLSGKLNSDVRQISYDTDDDDKDLDRTHDDDHDDEDQDENENVDDDGNQLNYDDQDDDNDDDDYEGYNDDRDDENGSFGNINDYYSEEDNNNNIDENQFINYNGNVWVPSGSPYVVGPPFTE